MGIESFTNDELKDMLLKMLHIRKFEEKVALLFSMGKVHGTTHLYVGEEATAVGACKALEADDLITSTHRGHGHCIANGIELDRMMAEFLGKETGCCKGKGGSMHIADVSRGNLGANGVVGGGIPIAVGAGLTTRMKGLDRVILCFFGDGAMNQGVFHESLNLASIWRLPVIFVCENNLYGMSMHVQRSTNIGDLSVRASAYGIPGRTVDGNDVFEVFDAVREARAHVRESGPSLLVCNTYRIMGHSKSDANRYRTKEEIADWRGRCPILRMREVLLSRDRFTTEELDAMDREAAEDIETTLRFAEESPFPSLDTILEDVYAPSPVSVEPEAAGMRELTFAEALREAMSEEMRLDDDVFLMGEDVGVYGGAFGVSVGMIEEFGAERIRDTPISEAVIAGAAVGAAVTSMRPVAEIMFSDFTTIAMDQLVNQAAKIRYMFGGRACVPMVLRTAAGAGTGAAAQHSQSLEAWFCHVPGLKVVFPSTPYEAKGLLKSAIRDDNPVIFIEEKLLYRKRGPVPEYDYTIPLGSADVKRRGTDISIVAWGRMVDPCLAAAERLSNDGIECEIIDPRTLIPLDTKTIISSVRKTGRVLIVHEAVKTAGFGGEVAAMIAESEAFFYLDAPIHRLAGLDVPIPYCPELERSVVPTEETILETIRRIVE